ncbi:glycine cleavage system protein R [Oceanobacter kriegii]|uniref:glycine cleavage system protein R n=1 Tax=Oceanobacter kriegii TaxID=64972 RepID=UPI000480FF33|nr:ACT domain-containing protein [Oceanobacter kriegii]
MTTSLVLTVIADDKPGIVEHISAVISAHNGNWTESRMASLAGKFAGIIHVKLEDEAYEPLIADLGALAGKGIEIRAERGSNDEEGSHHLNLSLVGNDRAGIVSEVSGKMAKLGVNVLELTTYCFQAEMTGVTMFHADAELQVPDELDDDDVKEALEQLSDELMVEITPA